VVELFDDAIARGTADTAIARRARALVVANLQLVKDAGVNIVIGSDRYSATSVSEVFGLRATRVFSDLELLRMWSTATPRAIFPGRKIGKLDAGFDANFLVLAGNPLTDFENVKRIRMRFKEGVLLQGVRPE
jgi:imidazolonepropionase-like amidohydrolase